jgi:hypothetical protein
MRSYCIPALLLLALALAGCRSLQLEPYTAPRVTGRVLAADTRQPLEGVKVTRDHSERRAGASEPPKGGRLMDRDYSIRTGSEGRFDFSSQRELTIFHSPGQQFIQLDFERSGFDRFQTNFSMLKCGTNTPGGEPLLETGDILLRRSTVP